MMNYRETTKQGYEILSLVDTGAMITEDRPYLLAIAKRETDFKPYIFCDGYDLTNGTWGTGSYYDSFDDASVYLAKRLLDWTATYRDDGAKTLLSYNTPIIRRNPDGTLKRLWFGWSATTGRHIASFCGLSKKQFEDLR